MSEAFRAYCRFFTAFPLAEFDAWLERLEDGATKEGFTNARADVLEVFNGGADDEILHKHLEALYFRWKGLSLVPLARTGANVKKARAGKRQRFSARLVVAELKKELNLVSADQLVQEWRAGLLRVGEHEIECEEINGRFIARADSPNSPFYDRKVDVLESTIRDAFVR